MNCRDRDADLLLLAHNELSAWQSRIVRAHVRCCPCCQMRIMQLTSASEAFAGAVRDSSMARWSPRAGSIGNLTFFSPVRLLLASLVIMVLIVTTLVLRSMLVAPQPHLPTSDSGVCAPNLPNDRCR